MQGCTGDFNQERALVKKKGPQEITYCKNHNGKYRHRATNYLITPLGTAAEGVAQQGRDFYLALGLINSHRILKT